MVVNTRDTVNKLFINGDARLTRTNSNISFIFSLVLGLKENKFNIEAFYTDLLALSYDIFRSWRSLAIGIAIQYFAKNFKFLYKHINNQPSNMQYIFQIKNMTNTHSKVIQQFLPQRSGAKAIII